MIALILALQGFSPSGAPDRAVIRINQLGYLPNGPKTAVMCVVADTAPGSSHSAPASVTFIVQDTARRQALARREAKPAGSFGPCAETYRLDFASLRTPGQYRIIVENYANSSLESPY